MSLWTRIVRALRPRPCEAKPLPPDVAGAMNQALAVHESSTRVTAAVVERTKRSAESQSEILERLVEEQRQRNQAP